MSAGFTYGIGEAFGHGSSMLGAKALAHGAVSSIMTRARGGRWNSGFWSGFAGTMLSPMTGMAKGYYAKVASSAIVAGTVSIITGGKFANGALSGSFRFMFNEAMHPKVSSIFGFIKHYFGDGTPRNVTDEYIFSDSAQKRMSAFENKAIESAKINGLYYGWSRETTDVTLESSYLFSIGDTGNNLGIGSKGFYISGSCSNGSCFFTYDLYDRFRDPFDIGIGLPNSKPYDIYGHWTKEILY